MSAAEQRHPSGEQADRPGRTGAGSEAAEGVHAAQGERDEEQRTSVESAGTGLSSGGGGETGLSGSEPLCGRTQEHQSGYGGQGGLPKTSSDERE